MEDADNVILNNIGGSIVDNDIDETANAVAEINKVIIDNFVLADKYSDEMWLNAMDRHKIKMEAFNIIYNYYVQTYNDSLEKTLHYKDNHFKDEIIVFKSHCVHTLIEPINKLARVITTIIDMPKFKYSAFIFLPYCRQLIKINDLFSNDYCCGDLISNSNTLLQSAIDRLEAVVKQVRKLHDCVRVMMVFDDKCVLYECNICHETSAEKHFLKENECCGYDICNKCYAQLWKHSNMYPVCPVCKTSFKTVCIQTLEKS
ncbi:Immediate early 0 [Trabala vishnou gigantina nucleopolyhedrovirus]|uniref:Immediate early 0 n=1 Tax=Trabala vishnou gigantina nucleopolyhedrovirus TaxID=2863583 RepID=UPI0024820055|nr:Immediate early 0 [Trabala vishnou gigantina nucleopolyhedrovirus]QYC92722.1 Immediate early 0 [Trabala vishnou gigantina nucleopolyhedrovirus]